jgi:hypothetical protein
MFAKIKHPSLLRQRFHLRGKKVLQLHFGLSYKEFYARKD